MAAKRPQELKTKDAILRYILSRARHLSRDLTRTGTDDAGGRLRQSMNTLLQSADLVMEIGALGEALDARAPDAPKPRYFSLAIGQLQILGYLVETPTNGILRDGSGTAGKDGLRIKVSPAPHGFRVDLAGPDFSQGFDIASTDPSFGGKRQWFICSGLDQIACGRRALKLYRCSDVKQFACKDCHRATHDHSWRSARDRQISLATLAHAA